jgi:hypothetical protein
MATLGSRPAEHGRIMTPIDDAAAIVVVGDASKVSEK